MTVKTILSDFMQTEPQPGAADQKVQQQIRAEIEDLMIKLNRCFVEVILPSVFETERDLHQAGYWNHLNIGQSTSLSSGKPNIREVTLYFFPERLSMETDHQRLIDSAYRAVFTPTRDMRKIDFSIHFSKKIPQLSAGEQSVHRVETIHTAQVDRFLERFVKGAVDAYASDRMFR